MDKNTASRQKQVAEFQKSLGDTIILLLELKHRPGVSRPAKREIDDVVERLHEIIRSLPEVADRRSAFQVVFRAIQKAHRVWQKLFKGGG